MRCCPFRRLTTSPHTSGSASDCKQIFVPKNEKKSRQRMEGKGPQRHDSGGSARNCLECRHFIFFTNALDHTRRRDGSSGRGASPNKPSERSSIYNTWLKTGQGIFRTEGGAKDGRVSKRLALEQTLSQMSTRYYGILLLLLERPFGKSEQPLLFPPPTVKTFGKFSPSGAQNGCQGGSPAFSPPTSPLRGICPTLLGNNCSPR